MTMGWFDTTEVDAFAKWVVSEVVQRMPPDSLNAADPKLGDRIQRMNAYVSGRATAMAAEKRPNFYKRARLANQVKWGLRDAGYTSGFADTFCYELATLITVSAGKPRKP
jgi:hypothetical protein